MTDIEANTEALKANTEALKELTVAWGKLNKRAKEIDAIKAGGTVTAGGVPFVELAPAPAPFVL